MTKEQFYSWYANTPIANRKITVNDKKSFFPWTLMDFYQAIQNNQKELDDLLKGAEKGFKSLRAAIDKTNG